MSTIFGSLNLSDTDRVFQATIGQRVIYEAAVDYINRVNADLNAAMSVFVERSDSAYKLRYKSPGGGYLQKRQEDGRYGAVKAYGSWDVAFPLEDFGAQIASNDVARAYMTVAELDRHILTIVSQNVNTVRFELLKALFNNAADTFIDPLWGSLSIQPLANGDTVTYPPVIGASAEATEDHYLESGYAAASITNTNNPYETMVAELAHHFGQAAGGDDAIVFINAAEAPETKALTAFVGVGDSGIRYGTDSDLATIRANTPGVPLGRMEGLCWVVQWDFIPAGWALGVRADVEAPLIRRIDPADTGLGDGLRLVATNEEFPFQASFWRHRFGFGAGNRLNGVAMEFGTGGTYSIPTDYQ
jgi:hypothetical protein